MSDEQPISPPPEGRSLKQRAILIGALVVFIVLAWLIGAAILPRWWAQRMGNLIDGRLAYGTTVGLGVGFVFTVAPLAVAAIGWKWRKSWKRAGYSLLAVLIAAAPNLATLGIVMGNGNAAHAGERILDVDGPGFRGGSLVGAIAGALAATAIWYLVSSRARNKRRANELRAELDRSSD